MLRGKKKHGERDDWSSQLRIAGGNMKQNQQYLKELIKNDYSAEIQFFYTPAMLDILLSDEEDMCIGRKKTF